LFVELAGKAILKLIVFSAVVIAAFLNGCGGGKPPTTASLDPKAWFIESWDDPVITVKHDGKTYKAKCDKSWSEWIDPVTKEDKVTNLSFCDLAVDQVGRSVQPWDGLQELDGKRRDADGFVVVMWNVGGTLALRRWKAYIGYTPWRQENFSITSVRLTP
jgi:hypothetical protein